MLSDNVMHGNFVEHCKNFIGRQFVSFFTMHAFDGRTDGQNNTMAKTALNTLSRGNKNDISYS